MGTQAQNTQVINQPQVGNQQMFGYGDCVLPSAQNDYKGISNMHVVTQSNTNEIKNDAAIIQNSNTITDIPPQLGDTKANSPSTESSNGTPPP